MGSPTWQPWLGWPIRRTPRPPDFQDPRHTEGIRCPSRLPVAPPSAETLLAPTPLTVAPVDRFGGGVWGEGPRSVVRKGHPNMPSSLETASPRPAWPGFLDPSRPAKLLPPQRCRDKALNACRMTASPKPSSPSGPRPPRPYPTGLKGRPARLTPSTGGSKAEGLGRLGLPGLLRMAGR